MAIVEDDQIKIDEVRAGESPDGLVIYGVRYGDHWGFGEHADEGTSIALALKDLAGHVLAES